MTLGPGDDLDRICTALCAIRTISAGAVVGVDRPHMFRYGRTTVPPGVVTDPTLDPTRERESHG